MSVLTANIASSMCRNVFYSTYVWKLSWKIECSKSRKNCLWQKS